MTPTLTPMLLHLFWIGLGLAILLLSGDLLVRGSVALAQRVRIPPMLIGLTIVAFGTSAPELVIGVNAVLIGGEAGGLAIGNIVGSNIANVFLVLGVPALIYPTCCKQPLIRRNTTIMIGATLLFIWLCLDGAHTLTKIDGAILFAGMMAFMGYAVYRARAMPGEGLVADLTEELEEMSGLPESTGAIIFFIGIAMIGLPLGSNFIVSGAVGLAMNAGISATVIGLSIIAIGTSLPELATTVIAAVHRHSAVALGNVIGSNLFNILGIMGVTALVAPQPLIVEGRFLITELWIMLAATFVLVPYSFLHLKMGRVSGVLFLGAYVLFIVALFRHHGLTP
ncbi:MAG: calcium/sodium antiporter [Alphaproteobacteria bacterium]